MTVRFLLPLVDDRVIVSTCRRTERVERLVRRPRYVHACSRGCRTGALADVSIPYLVVTGLQQQART